MDEILIKLFGLLDQLVEERGVPKQDDAVSKNILKSENSTFDVGKRGKIRSNLSPSERKKLTEAYTLFNKMFFEYQEKQKKDVGEKTLVTKIARTQKKASAPPPEKKGGGLMSMILAGLSMLGVAILGLVGGISGIFGDFGGVAKIVGKFGLLGVLKQITKIIGKRFAKSVLKKLPVIGGIIGLSYAAMAFMDGNIFLGISELISGLLNFVPYVGPFLSLGADILIAWAQAKGMFNEGGALSPENGWNTIKGWASSIWNVIWDNALWLPVLGSIKRFGMANDAFSSGNVLEGLYQIGAGLVSFTNFAPLVTGLELLMGWFSSTEKKENTITPDVSWMTKMTNWIREKLKVLPDWLQAPLKWFGILEDDEAKTSATPLPPKVPWTQRMKAWLKEKMNSLPGPIKTALGWFGIGDESKELEIVSFTKDTMKGWWDKGKKLYDKTQKQVVGAYHATTEYVKDFGQGMAASAKGLMSMTEDYAKKIYDKTKKITTDSIKTVTDKTKGLGTTIAEGISNITDQAKKTLTPSKDTKKKESFLGMATNVLKDQFKTMAKGTVFEGMAGDFFKSSENEPDAPSIVDKSTVAGAEASGKTPSVGATVEGKLSPKLNLFEKIGGMFNVEKEEKTITMDSLYESSEKQVTLLSSLVNITTLSLMELKRMAGGSSVILSPQNIQTGGQGKSTTPINVQGNRSGYLSSAYSLG